MKVFVTYFFSCFLKCWYVHLTSPNVMLLGEIFTWNALSTHPINLVVKNISQNKPVVQTPVTYFINQKEKHVSIQPKSIKFDEIWHTIFSHWYNLHGLFWCELFFSRLSQCLLWETYNVSVGCKNYTYKDGTFLLKKVKFLSIRHDLKFNCVKMTVFETHFEIFNSCFFAFPACCDKK